MRSYGDSRVKGEGEVKGESDGKAARVYYVYMYALHVSLRDYLELCEHVRVARIKFESCAEGRHRLLRPSGLC